MSEQAVSDKRSHAMAYSALSVPVEITRSIFSLYINSPHIGCMDMFQTIGRGPLRLASVCKAWRQICISHPALWASFRVYAHEMYHSRIDAFIDFLRCWIARAGSLPLDIFIAHPLQNYPDGSLSSGMTKIWFTLPEFSTRLRSLHVVPGMWESFPTTELQRRLPNLERLTIAAGYGYDTSVTLTGFQEVPRLREICLAGFTVHSISLPWTQLTHLELESDSGDPFLSVLEILEQTTQLAVLLLEFPEAMEDDPEFTHPPVTLNHLHTLRLCQPMDSRILRYLTLPVLKTLDVGYVDKGAFQIIHTLGERSTWSLRTISLAGPSCKSVMSLFGNIPSLQEAEIIDPLSTLDPLFERLRADRGLLPDMRAMAIVRYGYGVRAELLGKMISARRGNAGSRILQSFHLFFEDEARMSGTLVEEIQALLRPMKEDGLDFALGTQSHASILNRKLSITSRGPRSMEK
ncbi:hypothetical protein DFH08DRAFT_905585 [Mycena albidolilacea]|uniref:F-box domain-containing protein n=1 Tax=Mycena albidolilacea TaxID=1033008 RepID=A0AAD7E7V0_9AGAR|nr:hypothetical protein DFH08DRAFT_905585 [Mycena albidolilacea]